MSGVEMILEYLRVLIWPLFVGFLIMTQKNAITRLIDRIKQVNLPGGGGFDTGYNPELPKDRANPEVSNPMLDVPQKVAVLERDFNNYILAEVEAN